MSTTTPAAPTLDPTEVDRLRLALLRVVRKIRTSTDESITPSQVAVLSTLSLHGPSTVGQIAEYENVKPPSASRIVSALEERGFIKRTPHVRDARSHTVALTPAAEKWLKKNRATEATWLSGQLEQLTAKDVKALKAVVPALEHLLELED